MKNSITLSLIAVALLATQGYAGGDISPEITFEMSEKIEASKIKVVLPVEKKPVEIVAEKPVVKEVFPPKVEKKSLWSIGAGLTIGTVSDAHCEDITYGVVAKLGYEFNKYVAVEIRGLQTNWEYEGAKIKHLGAFVKPQYPLNKDFNLYGLIGYAKTTTNHKKRVDETGMAYGAGIDYDLTTDFSLFVDYERLLQKSDAPDLDALSLGLSFNF